MILIHELAHIRCRDTLWRTLLEGVAIVFRFHPLVWLVLRRYDEQTEKACDDAVLQANYPLAQYAEALLAATKPPQLASVSTQASAPVGLRGRMFSVLNKEKNRLPLTWNATAKFMVFFSIIIIPIALISFTPYPTDQGYEIVKDPEDLSALWRMKLGRGSILPDSSGGENHGKIHGAKWVLESPISAGNNYEGLVSDLAVYQKYLSAKDVIKVMRGNFSITK